MKKYNDIFKKWDIVVIVILLFLSFIPEIIFGLRFSKNYDVTYADITIGGELYKSVPLTGHKGEETFVVDTNWGSNMVIVKDESIAIIEADCFDEVCLDTGFINKPGQSIVCLPHKVMIQIKGSDDDIILSY